jgi:serine protease Do
MVLATLTAAAGISDELAALADRVRPSVVEVRDGPGAGSGVIWAPDGLIVTNHHVVPGARAQVRLADGRTFSATVERRDPGRDLAALRLDADGLPAAPIGDSRALRVGQIVVAVGNPHGQPRVVTVGVVSGEPEGSQGRLRWRNAVAAEIELRPGNSGGPLLNAAGEVVAINSMVIGPRLALSIPSHTVQAFLRQTDRRPRLGVAIQPVPLPAFAGGVAARTSALLVTHVDDAGPADAAGLLPGDLLLDLELPLGDGRGPARRSLADPDDLLAALVTSDGQPITFHLLRGGRPLTLTVTPSVHM